VPIAAAKWEAYAGAWRILDRDKGIEPSFGFAERTLRRLAEPQLAISLVVLAAAGAVGGVGRDRRRSCGGWVDWA